MISDPVALQHILNNRSFIRAPTQLQMGKLVFGERSVYCAEGKAGCRWLKNFHLNLQARITVGFVRHSVQVSPLL
jgi:hypothetical protein